MRSPNQNGSDSRQATTRSRERSTLKGTREEEGITLIIPVLLKKGPEHTSLADYLVKFAGSVNSVPFPVQVIIADQSESEVYDYLEQRLKGTGVEHFKPTEKENRRGKNGKLNNIHAALQRARFDRVLILDDHYRVKPDTLVHLYQYYKDYAAFNMMPRFDRFPLGVLVDLAGAFVVCLLTGRQFFGHNAVRKSAIDMGTFPASVLWDEIAITKYIEERGHRVGFIKDIALECTQQISLRKFMQQRVRYAYENLYQAWQIIPLLLSIHLIIYPLLEILLSISSRLQDTMVTIAKVLSPLHLAIVISALCLFLAAIGESIHRVKMRATFDHPESHDRKGFAITIVCAICVILSILDKLGWLDGVIPVRQQVASFVHQVAMILPPVEVLVIGMIMILLLLSFIGQRKYGKEIVPSYTFIFAIVWFWQYVITTPMALVLFLIGGIKFGGNRIRRPY